MNGMREIKFRNWCVQEKVMVLDGVVIAPDGKAAAFSPLDGRYVRSFSHDEVIPLQYTGLKDKNGQEIYEGDILCDPTGVGEVKWVQEHCAYLVFTKDPTMYHRLESDGKLLYSEVIGNIYANPDLIKA